MKNNIMSKKIEVVHFKPSELNHNFRKLGSVIMNETKKTIGTLL